MSRSERLAENERKIREINEEVELVARDAADSAPEAASSTEVEFLCACGRPDCAETVLLTVAEYEAVHHQRHRFVLAPGHETAAVEQIVERHPSYIVVEKKPQFQRPE